VADRLRRGEPAITTCQVSKHITDKSNTREVKLKPVADRLRQGEPAITTGQVRTSNIMSKTTP
jgi:hypothetical protein